MENTANSDIQINEINTCTLSVNADEGILRELHEFYTFEVPGFQFMPTYQSGLWNGKIYCFNLWKRELPAGLFIKTIAWAKKNNYSVTVDPKILPIKIPIEEFDELYEQLHLPEKFIKEDHQTFLIKRGLELKRALVLSPTGSGKSLIIYALIKIIMRETGKKALIVTPTINLVSQIPAEFKEYGYKKAVNKFSETKDKYSDAEIYISTYHSLYKLPEKFFDQFGVIIADEAHEYTAKTTKELISKTGNIPYKFGTTATLQDTKCHSLVLEGMFGIPISCTTTKKLIDAGKLASAKVIALVLNHPEEVCKRLKAENSYVSEIEEIINSPKRNAFLVNFISKVPKNTLVLFNHIDHGTYIRDKIKQHTNRPVYYIDGSVKAEVREEIRLKMEVENNAILLAQLRTASTGLNIKNLHNVFFIHPSKQKNRTLQSIGRILRKLVGKTATVFDIADNMMYKKHKNITLDHFLIRLETYHHEQYPVILKEIKL